MLLCVALLLAITFFVLGRTKPGLALISMLMACGVFVFIMLAEGNPGTALEVVFAIPLVIIGTLSSIQLAKRDQGRKEWPLAWAKWLLLGFVSLLIFLLLGVIGLYVIEELPAFGFPIFILFLAMIGLIGAAINYALTSRSSTAAYVISTIGASMRQNLPLPMALESAAGKRSDKRAMILRRISKWLVQGFAVSDSIERGFPKCPSYAVAMIAAADRINQLPQAFSSIEADMTAKTEDKNMIEPVHPFYPLVLVVFLSFVVWGVLTFFMPSFINVLTETTESEQLPAATRTLMRIVHFIVLDYGVLFFIALAFIVLVVIPSCIYVRFRQRRPCEPYTSSQIGDFLKWHLPLLRSFEKNYSILHVAEMLRLSLNAGTTVNGAISNALCLDVNACYRKRLQIWFEKIEAGENISKAARDSGVGDGLAWVFDDQVNQGNTLAVLETIESLHRSNYNYKANLVRFIASPCVTLIMGAIVGFVVYAIYSAPVAIIHHAVEAVYP